MGYWRYRNQSGGLTTLTTVRSLELATAMGAEEGKGQASTLIIDDPTGSILVGGHRLFVYTDDDAGDPEEGGVPWLYIGYSGEREYELDDLIESVASGGRRITVSLTDINTVISRRLFTASDAERPAETDVERITWALGEALASLIDDDRYFDTSDPVAMDAHDYRGETLERLFSDCAVASQKNYFVTYFADEDDVTDDDWAFSFGYLPIESDVYDSDVTLTNVAAEVDGDAWILSSHKLSLSPHRVYSKVVVARQGGMATANREATATAFARRDILYPASHIKDPAKAQALADKLVQASKTEEYRLAAKWLVSPEDVNRLREGMRTQVKLDRYVPEIGSDWVYGRLLDRQVSQTEDETGLRWYLCSATIALDVPAPPTPCESAGPTPGGSWGPLNGSGLNPADGSSIVWYGGASGDNNGDWAFPSYGTGGSPDYSQSPYWGVGNKVVLGPLVGAGKLTVQMAAMGGGATMRWAVHAHTGGMPWSGGFGTPVASGTFSVASPVEVDVDTDGGARCEHVVIITIDSNLTATHLGFAGATWTSTEED